jgi:uncharacterized protein (TIGR04255 family)
MALNFPEQPDVQLEKPPLINVICQVMFPPILSITSKEPDEFQERIRREFPQLETEYGLLVRVPKPGARGEPEAEPSIKIYRFYTADEQTTVALTQDFYALSTHRYQCWEDFAAYLNLAHQAVQSVYAPTYATRIGLRYINRFTLDNTGCQMGEAMLDFLRQELTAQLRAEVWDIPSEMKTRLQFIDDEAKFTLGIHYGQEENSPFLLVDFDYFQEGQLELDDVVTRCGRYNEVIYRAFRWCVPDDKLEVFLPRPKEI